MSNEIDKIKFQLKQIGYTLKNDHLVSLILEYDWGEEDLETANDIFESWRIRLEGGDDFSLAQFEADFKSKLNMSYQSVKMVVLAFYESGFWQDVCKTYAKNHEVSEMHSILRDIRCEETHEDS